MSRSTRRTFLRRSTVAGIGFWVAGGIEAKESKSANEKLNLAIIGVGGRGGSNLNDVSSENIVALCDVDANALGKAAAVHPKARKYADFRKLYEQTNDIDAVVVSTTEHTHSFAVLPALALRKHVYCEKPLAHTVSETRLVMDAAAVAKVATQMGTQIHATENYRRVVELVQAGAIGPVRDVHVWVSRDWGGGERPKDTPPVPAHLDWDLWIGPAPMRPYHPAYAPGPSWYKWWDFGNGTMPDLGSHMNDLPFWALKLKHPTTIEAEGPPPHPETAPVAYVVRWEFPARAELPPVKLTWYQGGKQPDLIAQGKIPSWGSGILFLGDKGMLLADYGRHLLLPESQFADYKRPEPTIPKSLGHHKEWLHACKTGAPTTCPFSYSGLLTVSNLLGIAAYRAGKRLEWDAEAGVVTNCPEAGRFIRKEFRKGWTLGV